MIKNESKIIYIMSMLNGDDDVALYIVASKIDLAHKALLKDNIDISLNKLSAIVEAMYYIRLKMAELSDSNYSYKEFANWLDSEGLVHYVKIHY